MRRTWMRLVGAVLLGLAMVEVGSIHLTYAAPPATINDCPGTEAALSSDITLAGNGGTVAFNCSTATTIHFDSAGGGSGTYINIVNSSVTLDASSSAAVTLDGGGSPNGTQLFEVAGGTLTLNGLTLADGYNAFGAAIYNNGSTLNIANSTFSNNVATPGDGGAILVTGGKAITNISSSAFSGNTALDGNVGGAIANSGGQLTISDSSFSGNQAGYAGGAIRNTQGGQLTISGQSTFTNNAATGATGDGGSNGGFGGAISTDSSSPVTIGTGSNFSTNSAAQFGGAISADILTLTGGTFSGNSAGYQGGAIYTDPGVGATASITATTFSNNTAACSVDPCSTDGGALANGGTATIANSSFAFNSATCAGTFCDAEGGAIYNTLYPSAPPTVTITTSTLSDNSATFQGGSIANYGAVNIGGSIAANAVGGNCAGTISDNGYNLEDDSGASCGFSSINNDIVGSDPHLTPLAFNGGPTQTMGLPPDSPALDQIPITNSLCPNTDQRGYTRPDNFPTDDGLCDMGAFESGGALPPAQTSLSQVSGSAAYGGQATLTATLKDVNGVLLSGEKITFKIGNTPVCDVSGQPSCPQTGTSGASLGVATVSGVTLPSGYTDAGSHAGAVVASFAGDRGLASSSGTSDLTVTGVTTSTSLGSSANPSSVGQQVTYTATVNPVPDGGTMAFKDGGSSIGCDSRPVSTTSGTATCTVLYNSTGSHSITAAYSGHASFAGSTSSTVSQQVVGYTVHTVSTSRLTIVVQLWDANNADVSSSTLPVTAECVVPSSTTVPTNCAGAVQSINKPFTFVAATKRVGAEYSYRLSSAGLTRKHSYYLLVQAGSDPNWQAVQFTN